MSQQTHILVVDDDDRLRSLLKTFLREHGYAVSTAASAAEAREALELFAIDAMILDVMMPDESGIEFARSLPDKHLPILILSARSEAEDRIDGLEAGVDDYLTKPFEPKELILRLQALMRRASKQEAKPLSFGECIYNPHTNLLTRKGETVHLTSGESALLRALSARVGRPVSREELAKLSGLSNERSVDVQITRLRKKIEPSEKPLYIQTVRGEGYGLFAA